MSHLLILIGLIMLMIAAPGLGWVAAGFYLLYRFFRKAPESYQQEISSAKSQYNASRLDPWLANPPDRVMTIGNLADLMLLSRELERLFESGAIDAGQRDQWLGRIDTLSDHYFADRGAVPDNAFWRERRDAAWDLLNAYADEPLGRPPWPEATPQTLAVSCIVESEISLAAKAESESSEPLLEADTSPAEMSIEVSFDATDYGPEVSSTIADAGASDRSVAAAPLAAAMQPMVEFAEAAADSASAAIYVKPGKSRPDIENYAWQRHEPGRLEQALKALSGWHAMAAPFLVQNIGWFIGVFCFIAGSIFLVSYSTGYAKNLTVFLTLFIFTLFLLWGGYQIRSKRPELSTSSDVILLLSVLLVPLTTATATRLVLSSESWLLKSVSGLLAGIEFGAFYVAVTVVSALMDRSLQQRLPRVFLGLTFAQLLLLILEWLPYWPMLALVHSALFAILSYGVFLFVRDWLHSIFIDRRKIAYFAGGMLVYAAVVSFVHLTWGTEKNIDLPAGYHGPFLMMLCGLLFFVDAQFKQWVDRHAALSRFSFLIYGLSVLALFLVARQPPANIITLMLALALYAYVMWNYLTLIPLYIFLACAGWLYYLLFLQYVPEPAHFLAAMPGMAGLYSAAKWALSQRKSAHLAVIAYRVLYALVAMITVWSLGHSEPGFLAMATAASACALVYYALRSAPAFLFTTQPRTFLAFNPGGYHNLLDSRWFYAVPLLAAAAVYYSPLVPGLTRAAQFAFGLLLLAVFYGYRGHALWAQSFRTDPALKLEALFNSALLALLGAILLGFVITGGLQGLLLAIAGTIALWFSLTLRVRGLFYLMLMLWGASAAIIKLTYFPSPSTGLAEMIVAAAIWFLLRYQQGVETSDYAALERDHDEMKARLLPAFELLWVYRVNAEQEDGHDA